jgi:hypothetical protein
VGRDGIGERAVEGARAVVELEGDIGGRDGVDILEIESGIVGTTEGILEEHGDEGGGGAGGGGGVGGDFGTDVRTTDGDQGFVGGD